MKTRVIRDDSGFTLVELMIVMAIVGIISSFVIPNYLGMKDKATWGATKANLDVIRHSLASYAADSSDNRYPDSISGWSNLIATLPEANLPSGSDEAKIVAGSFSYASSGGDDFTVSVTSTNSFADTLTATPAGITPENYPH